MAMFKSKNGRMFLNAETNPNPELFVETTEAEHTKETLKRELAELKQHLADTDYVSCKIADGVATHEEYAEILEQRQAWRVRINEIEAELA